MTALNSTPLGCMNTRTLLSRDFLADWRSGSTEPWTVNVLAALVNATTRGPQHILETGTFEAKTTVRLHFASAEGSTLVSLELDEERWEKASAKCLDLEGVTILNVDALDFLSSYNGPPFNFVFLDDDHTAEHVAQELDLLYNHATGGGLMAPGGLICVHDVVGPFGLGAVVVARHGFLLDLPKLHVAGGLGLIQVPAWAA